MSTIVKWASSLTAVAVLLSGTWYVLNDLGIRPVLSREIVVVQEQVAANTKALELQRWQYLKAKLENQGLSPGELLEFCALSGSLHLRVRVCAS